MNNEGIKIAIAGDCSDWNLRGITKDNIPLEIREKIKECDIFIFNLEGPIINDQIVAEGVIKNCFIRKVLASRGKLQPVVANTENLLDILNLAEINVACLANNHILDAGREGVEFTLKTLDRKGFLFLGAGRNINEASKPLTIEVKGKKIGILNYNFIGLKKIGFFVVNLFGAAQKRAGANHANKQRIIEEVKNLSEQVDYTIAVMHIGKELHEILSLEKQQFLESLKADLIVVHHAHIAQSITSKKVISCGDFIFNYPEHLPEDRNSNVIFYNCGSNIRVLKIKIKGGTPCLKN